MMSMQSSSLWPPCDVTLSPMGGITGWMSWPYDSIYRPVVGLFAQGSLRAAVPTFRIRQVISGEAAFPRKASWKAATNSVLQAGPICAFHFGIDHAAGKSPVFRVGDGGNHGKLLDRVHT